MFKKGLKSETENSGFRSMRKSKCAIAGLKMEWVIWQRIQVATTSWKQPGRQPVKNVGPQSYSWKELNSENKLNKHGNRFFPRASRWELVRLWAEDTIMLCQTSDLQMSELRKESFVKLISAWFICHAIVNNYIMGQKYLHYQWFLWAVHLQTYSSDFLIIYFPI